MSKQFLSRVALVAFVFAGGVLASHFATARASAAAPAPTPVTTHATASAPQFGSDAQCTSKVPRAWGDYKGGSAQSGLAFQAPDGTLRFITNLPCGTEPPVALKIVRTGNAN